MAEPLPPSRGHLDTERAHPRSVDLDRLSVGEALALIRSEDANLPEVVAAANDSIAAAIELVVGRLRRGGRLFYVGAGTSGRLGVLDAVECPPTFQCPVEQIQAVIAGGERAVFRAVEGAEDDEAAGAEAMRQRRIDERDAVFGITAGGTTPFVHGALRAAREAGAATVFLACVPRDQAPDEADASIRLETGPELLQGSTRMRAGTATKMVLNSFSTLVMVQLGKVYGNRMIDVDTRGNAKLRERGIRMIAELCRTDPRTAAESLDRAGGSVKLAVLMREKDLDVESARSLLAAHDGHLRRALEDHPA